MSFKFGAAGSSGNNNLFGQSSNPAQTQTSSTGLFGATPGTSAPSGQAATATSQPAASALFGSAGSTPGNPTVFGGNAFNSVAKSGMMFGGGSASNPTSGSSTPTLFGSSTGNTPAVGLFGASKPPTTSSSATAAPFGGLGTNATPSAGGGFNFAGNKTENNAPNPTTTAAPSLTHASGGNMFSNLNKTAAPASIFGGASTPAKPSGLMFSTTPAGAPPAAASQTTNGGGNSLFPTANSSGSLFGNPAAAPSTSNGGLFGGLKSTSSAPASGALFAASKTPSAGASLFSGLGGATPTSTGANANDRTPVAGNQKSGFNFGPGTPSITTPGSEKSATTTASTSAPVGSLFGGQNAAAGSGTPTLFGGLKNTPTTTTATPSTLFSGASTTTASTNTTTSNTTASNSGGLFGGLGGNISSTPNTNATPNLSKAPATAGGLFGGLAGSSNTPPTSSTPATTGATAPAGITSTLNPSQHGASSNLGASTTGPSPQLSRLKNRTMDEIITRWASDLSKYQKEFQDQAAKVAAWDRLMVENGDKIQKLWNNTYDANKQSAEIERQLANVESQQDELSAWLDKYEGEVDDMFTGQLTRTESLQGPDQERERTYKLAEKLTDRLDDMGKNLTSMIEAINDASTTLSKTSKTDDPLSHIVRVLNSHLTQLQWIDENAMALQAKVSEAQKMNQSIGPSGYGGSDGDTADSFYRSLMGSRR